MRGAEELRSSSVTWPAISVTWVSQTATKSATPSSIVRIVQSARVATRRPAELRNELPLTRLDRGLLHVDRFVRAFGEHVLADLIARRRPVPQPISTTCTLPLARCWRSASPRRSGRGPCTRSFQNARVARLRRGFVPQASGQAYAHVLNVNSYSSPVVARNLAHRPIERVEERVDRTLVVVLFRNVPVVYGHLRLALERGGQYPGSNDEL